jgi:LPS export ABC transporter protein LptC
MGRFFQILLTLSIIILLLVFYKYYFSKKIVENKINNIEERINENSSNHQIKNLKYENSLNNNNKYIITSEQSEILSVDQNELVSMKKVNAIFHDKDGKLLTVTSDEALYNNFTLETKFKNNVKISFLDYEIISNNMDIDFQNNLIKIFSSVKFNGNKGYGETDNLLINLVTREIDLFMNSQNKNVMIFKKKNVKY